MSIAAAVLVTTRSTDTNFSVTSLRFLRASARQIGSGTVSPVSIVISASSSGCDGRLAADRCRRQIGGASAGAASAASPVSTVAYWTVASPPARAALRAIGTGTVSAVTYAFFSTSSPNGQAGRSSSALIEATLTSMSSGVPGTR